MKRAFTILLSLMIFAGCSANNSNNTQSSTPAEETPMASQYTPPENLEVKSLAEPAEYTPEEGEWPELTEEEQEAYREAADRLTKAMLVEGEAANQAITPLSMYMGLSMLAGGAEGGTLDELCAFLGMEKGELADFNMRLYQWLNGEKSMSTVNSLWVQPEWPIKEEYLEQLVGNYYAYMNETDFKSDKASEDIAGWIAEHTDGMLSPQLQFSPGTVMTLVNAILLKDEWQDNFDKAATKEQDFHLANSETVKVDMMNDETMVTLWMGENYRAIRLPLKTAGSMVFVLPNEGTTPYDLLKGDNSLASLCNLDYAAEAYYPQIEIGIPKFDISSLFTANDALKGLGINKVFDEQAAELEVISEERLWVSRVVHGTRVVVHEDGVAAAGFTTIAMEGAAMPDDRIKEPFILDRPFMFCIERGGLPLFTGIVDQPNGPGSVQAPAGQ